MAINTVPKMMTAVAFRPFNIAHSCDADVAVFAPA
jgi:hypothetical protein